MVYPCAPWSWRYWITNCSASPARATADSPPAGPIRTASKLTTANVRPRIGLSFQDEEFVPQGLAGPANPARRERRRATPRPGFQYPRISFRIERLNFRHAALPLQRENAADP